MTTLYISGAPFLLRTLLRNQAALDRDAARTSPAGPERAVEGSPAP